MTKIKNGDILQIPLPKELGFAYAKYLDLKGIDQNNRYPSMIRVYDRWTKDEKININDLKNDNLVLSPLLIAGIQPVLRKQEWKIIGNLAVTEEEATIPDYKYYDENKLKDWSYVVGADISKKVHALYDDVKHLETIGAIGTDLVGTKIAMALIKNDGKDIKSYFTLDEYFERVFYDQVIDIPIYYKQPAFQRGKAIRR